MTTREVVLDGGSPWGFRLHGGIDFNQPLRISRVNPGSKAALRGIREGDSITSINGQPAKNITNAQAHALLKESGETLKLGLNENCNGGSPKRRQYKTVHQETHSETTKKSSVTSYTSYTSDNEVINLLNSENIQPNGDSKNLIPKTPPRLSNSTSSSSASTFTEGGSAEEMADNGTTRSRRRRSRNNRKKPSNSNNNNKATKIEIEPKTTTTDSNYSVEFPESGKKPIPKISVKSKSLDDDEIIKIQELSEVSESEDNKGDVNKAIVVEAESDIESEKITKSSPPIHLELLEEPLLILNQPLISPEEELTLRNFLEGLNLVNSPEQVTEECNEKSTPESMKISKAKKRQALEQYFMPMAQNPRYLEVISEESSDLSDKEPIKFTRYLKQGTPELECRLVDAKILDAPLDNAVISTKMETKSEAEIVYLDSSPEDDETETTSETKLSCHILSQLTPPPTPDNISPKSGMSDFIKSHMSERNIGDCPEQQALQQIDEEGLIETSQPPYGDESLKKDTKNSTDCNPGKVFQKPPSNKSASKEIRIVDVKATIKTSPVSLGTSPVQFEPKTTKDDIRDNQLNIKEASPNKLEGTKSKSEDSVNPEKIDSSNATEKIVNKEVPNTSQNEETNVLSQQDLPIEKSARENESPHFNEESNIYSNSTSDKNKDYDKRENKEQIFEEINTAVIKQNNNFIEKNENAKVHHRDEIVKENTEMQMEQKGEFLEENDDPEIEQKQNNEGLEESSKPEVKPNNEIEENQNLKTDTQFKFVNIEDPGNISRTVISNNLNEKTYQTFEKSKVEMTPCNTLTQKEKFADPQHISYIKDTSSENISCTIKKHFLNSMLNSNTQERAEKSSFTSTSSKSEQDLVKSSLFQSFDKENVSSIKAHQKHDNPSEMFEKKIAPVPPSRKSSVLRMSQSFSKHQTADSTIDKNPPGSEEVLTALVLENKNTADGNEIKAEFSKTEEKNNVNSNANKKISKVTELPKEDIIPLIKEFESSYKKIDLNAQNIENKEKGKEVIVPIIVEETESTLTLKSPKTNSKEVIIPITREQQEESKPCKLQESFAKNIFIKEEIKNTALKEGNQIKKETIIPIFRESIKSNKMNPVNKDPPESKKGKEFSIPIKINEGLSDSEVTEEQKSTSGKEIIIPIVQENESTSLFKNNRFIQEELKDKVGLKNQEIASEKKGPKEEAKTELTESTTTTEKSPDMVYSNALSSPSPSKSGSSSDSSRTSPSTAKYNPNSSIADIKSIEDLFKKFHPLTLRELCLNYLMAQPFGAEILQELADVSKSIEAVTSKLGLSNPSFAANTKWVGLSCEENPKVVVCLSPTQKEELDKCRKTDNEGGKLLDLHQKFHDRAKGEADTDIGNRLLRIIRGDTAKRSPSMPDIRKGIDREDVDKARLQAKDLSEWLQLARGKSCMNLHSTNSMPRPGNNTNMQRRTSLPQEFYQRQMQYLLEKEREIQRELEYLEDEKRKISSEMAPSRQFHAEDFKISKRGDFAEKKSRPISMPINSETFRQQMYEEYMDKVQAKEERKHLKVIKVSISKQELSDSTVKTEGIAEEFMDKVKEKQKLGKLDRRGQKSEAEAKTDDECEPVLVMDGDSLTGTKKLPKHLQEFIYLTKQAAENDTDGVWSPGQKHPSPPRTLDPPKRPDRGRKDEPISPIWTPKSATSSPVVERKEFKPIKFESPILSRKNSQESSKEPSWKIPPGSSETGAVLSSSLQKRLPTSHSAPISGFSDFHRLPRAQNPTITLLQKAREGQLPRGASYIEQEPNHYPRRPLNEKPSHIGPGEIVYKIKNEYTSESDSEKPRKMVDLGPRKFEGIGPTTKDGMPLILRSEVKDANQSKWYKKMYETIHKQRPQRDEYVTVRYKQRRGQYPYTSGYLSEPEPGSYDSDFADYKYATLDRRRPLVQNKENTTPMSSTIPRNTTTKSSSTSEILKHGHEGYKNQPGRIEHYIPGHSSISEKEAKEWWDEVMDIFDGWLDDNSALPSYDYMLARALARSHLEQQKRLPQTKSFINQALKESGYESDSTLVFRRKEETAPPQLSPLEQKEFYKQIQKGGDVPFQGLRKPAPERPKDQSELEFFPISPTLTRIHVKPPKEIFCYPISVQYNQPFANYKRSAPSASTSTNIPDPPPLPPSPPKRRSSRNNSTLRLISTMKVKTEKSPMCKRHETCFTSSSDGNNTKVKYLRDKLTCKLSTDSKKKAENSTKPKLKISKIVSTSPQSKVVSTLTTGKNDKIESKTIISKCPCTTKSKKCKKCTTLKPNTFGLEKRKVDLVLPKKTATLVNSPPLLSPTEVKKAVQKSTTYSYKKTNAPIVSSKTGATLPVKVGISDKAKALIKSCKPKSPPLERKTISTIGRPSIRPKAKTIEKKLKKSKKDEINGEIAKTEMNPQEAKPELKTTLKKQKEAIQSDYFFQHLFLRDLSPTPSASSRNSWLIERTCQLQKRRTSHSEPSIGAMKVYLNHTKPVTDSRFRTLDQAIRSRSASPKSVTFETLPEKRSSSLPPKLHFSQTSRPVSPKVERRTPPLPRSPSCRKIMQFRGYSVPEYGFKLDRPKTESLYSSQSISSLDSCDSRDYPNYIRDLLRHSRRSGKFRELNEFYSTIEKLGRLELTTSSLDLKPRRKYEDEIIDYDRWREVRIRERAERELQSLYHQLRENEKEKGFLFRPKEPGRWKCELDRGLRIKEKSVDDIKREFEKIQKGEKSFPKLTYFRDTYKPLWRGDSVVNLANKMVERRSQSEGRVSTRQKLIDSECMLTHGIGSKLWSSLSMEQVNILKNQLSEIYSQNMGQKFDYSIEVPEKRTYKPVLSVRRNSDSSEVYSNKSVDFGVMSQSMPESDKKMLSQTISREVLDHIRKRNALPLVLAKETRGAIAAAEANLKPIKTSTESLVREEPEMALVKTDAITPIKISSTSETDSTDDSSRTVINLGKNDEIKKMVEYFENTSKTEYSPTVYKPADDETPPKPLYSEKPLSQSYQNLKELFGERDIVKFATLPLSATRKQQFYYSERPNLRAISPPRTISAATSTDSVYRSRSLSPFPNEPLALVKAGEVQRLKNQFDSPRRCKSDSSLSTSSVDALRRKYEYPVFAGRGRSRVRRGVVSPTFLRAEDRFMPHINIISKIASLYTNKDRGKQKEHSRSTEELAEILGCPTGEVEKMRSYFDKNLSLLGHMYTSSPNIKELRDISPYLAASWIAHRYPRSEDNTRSLSSPETSKGSRDVSLLRKDRPKSISPSPSKKSSILKQDLSKKSNKQRYQAEPVRYRSWWTSPTYTRPSVSFQEPEPPVPPPKGHHSIRYLQQESPRKYVENEVTIHYKTPVRQEIKEYLSEDELAYRQAEAMKKIYQEERRRKYLQVSKSLQELQDANSRRHTDNFIPSEKSPIQLNRYDDFEADLSPPVKPRPRSPEPRLIARALYNFVGQTSRELTFRKGDLIHVRRQVDKNWYEGELNAMVGLFPANYVEIVPYDTAKITPRKSHEGQARAKYNFVAQTHLELSLAKGELVVITRRVDDNWFEGKIGGRKGIFPVSYVEVLIDPSDPLPPIVTSKPVASPAAHSLLLNGSAGGKESMGSHSYTPQLAPSYHAKPVQVTTNYGSLNKGPVNQLHIETQSEPVAYRALYKYLPQNDDELELFEGDTVYVLEKCDDGWYVGSSERTGAFGTFPGNYVEKI